MELRPITSGDHESVLALNQGALDAVGPLDAERLGSILAIADRALVADDDGAVAGFAITIPPGTSYDSINYLWFGERYADFGYLDRIVVATSHRRRGVGTLLYDAAEDAAGPRGQMALEVYVEPPNVASLAFHSARGYAEVGRLLQTNAKTAGMLLKPLG